MTAAAGASVIATATAAAAAKSPCVCSRAAPLRRELGSGCRMGLTLDV